MESPSAKQIIDNEQRRKIAPSPLEKELKWIANEINNRQEIFQSQLEKMREEANRIKQRNIEGNKHKSRIRLYLKKFGEAQIKKEDSPTSSVSLDKSHGKGFGEIPSNSKFIAINSKDIGIKKKTSLRVNEKGYL